MLPKSAHVQPTTTAKPALSPTNREWLRRALEAKRAQLLRAHAERQEQAAEVQVEGVDLEDIAEGVIEDRQRAALEEHDLMLLQEVEHALSRIDDGTYGLSETTGRPISLQRLRALPWARS